MRLGKTFTERWKECFGTEPKKDKIEQIIREAIQVQQTRVLLRPDDGRKHKQLAIFWSPRENVIFKVDEMTGTVVTMLGRKHLRPKY